MDEMTYHNLPHIDTINVGDSIVLKEDVFVGGDKPKHQGTRYIVCMAMDRGNVVDTLDLEVINCVGCNPMPRGTKISRPIANVLSKGRGVNLEPISKTQSVGINDLYKDDVVSYKGDNYKVGGVTSCKKRVKCNGVDTSKEEEFDLEDFMNNSTLVSRK
jgi:hypothetical protein